MRVGRRGVQQREVVVVGRVRGPEGWQPVRLNQVANITMGEGPNKIERKNRLASRVEADGDPPKE